MTGPVLIPKEVQANLAEVFGFFGVVIDAWNVPIVRAMYQADPAGFAAIFLAGAEAVRRDRRYGITDRIIADMRSGNTKPRAPLPGFNKVKGVGR